MKFARRTWSGGPGRSKSGDRISLERWLSSNVNATPAVPARRPGKEWNPVRMTRRLRAC